MDKIFVKIPSEKKYISTVRLSISSIANTIDMDIECIEDLKVSISEVMNLFVDEGNFFEISIAVIEDKIEIEVLPDISISEIQQKEENKFALLILENLVDKIEFKEKSVLLVKNKG
ncbi:ATP-binding protein [Parvimonas micra]